MPQMSPLSWLSMFLMFSSIYLLFTMINYFFIFSENTNNMNKATISTTYHPWKW
uniref:ATPase 8 n=1 Tax=Tricholepidion gertschi TaxID=89825 RepID=Q85QS4_9INSE|nr:ATP synthase F0 subunit 8 [Tricholepidion gertschi]AAO40210.1 ATPase 8 [Tricholepidion gertschi]